MKKIIFFLIFITIYGCSQLSLEPSNFAWPIETVLDVQDDGTVQESRYSFATNVRELFIAETNDSSSFVNSSVRIIRDVDGYYYITSSGFKNVYLFFAKDGKLNFYDKYMVSEFGLDLPAFNQRNPYIEVLDGEKRVVLLNSDGIKGDEK